MVAATIWFIAQSCYTIYSSLNDDSRKLLEDPVFKADFPDSEVQSVPTLPEKLGGTAVAKIFSVGAQLMTDKDFDKRRREMAFDPRYDLKTIQTGDNILLDT